MPWEIPELKTCRRGEWRGGCGWIGVRLESFDCWVLRPNKGEHFNTFLYFPGPKSVWATACRPGWSLHSKCWFMVQFPLLTATVPPPSTRLHIQCTTEVNTKLVWQEDDLCPGFSTYQAASALSHRRLQLLRCYDCCLSPITAIPHNLCSYKQQRNNSWNCYKNSLIRQHYWSLDL